MTIQANIQKIKTNISDCEQRYHRLKDSVALLAASKGQSVDKIRAAYTAGLTAFGENYLQEALSKMAALAVYPEVDPDRLTWHFIGTIQRNKTKKIAEHFAWVHTVTDPQIAERLHRQRPAHLPPLNICLEVNISHEASKSGITNLESLIELAMFCKKLPRLQLRGLMSIPHPEVQFEKQRNAFHQVAQLMQQLQAQGFLLDTLSLGMSADYEAAIAEGATIVRIGTDIFGERAAKK